MTHKTAKINYAEWKNGDRATLSRQDCIEVHCFECNGKEDEDCGGEANCILYQYSQYGKD